VIDGSLYQFLVAMAEQTDRSVCDLVTDLLSRAIQDHHKSMWPKNVRAIIGFMRSEYATGIH
jgi:hypothetical protein